MIWHGVPEKGIYRGVRVECRFPDNSEAILSFFLSLLWILLAGYAWENL